MADWKGVLSSVAPALATALGGPLAGLAVQSLIPVLGLSPDATHEQVLTAIPGMTGDQMLAAKKADQDFQVQLKQLDIKLEEIGAGDRDSARQLFKINIWPQILLSALFVGGYFVVLYGMLTGTVKIDSGIRDVVILLLGLVVREVPTIMQFWFGTSSGSKDKDSSITNALAAK